MTNDMISTLPNETLVEIFSYLDSQSLQRCARVSKLFRDIATGNIRAVWNGKEGQSFNRYMELFHSHRGLYQIIDRECRATHYATATQFQIRLSNRGFIIVRYCHGYSANEFAALKPEERMKEIRYIDLIASQAFASKYKFYPTLVPSQDVAVINQVGLPGLEGVFSAHASIQIDKNFEPKKAILNLKKKIISILDKNIATTDRVFMIAYSAIVLLIALMIPIPKW